MLHQADRKPGRCGAWALARPCRITNPCEFGHFREAEPFTLINRYLQKAGFALPVVPRARPSFRGLIVGYMNNKGRDRMIPALALHALRIMPEPVRPAGS